MAGAGDRTRASISGVSVEGSAAATKLERSAGRRANAFGPSQPLHSPEQVELELEIAGPVSRAFAFGIDYALILILTASAFLLLVAGLQQAFTWVSDFAFLRELFERLAEWLTGSGAEPTREGSGLWAIAVSATVWLLLDLFLTTVYFLCFETLWRGRTPGKRLTHLRVVREDGLHPGWSESLMRNLLRPVDALPTGYLVGALAIFFSSRGQRLGDLVAGTLVVRDRDGDASGVPEIETLDREVETGFRFSREELAAVGEVERRLIRRTLRRTETLSPRASAPLLDRAVSALTQRIGRAEPVAGSSRRDFLVALLQAAERLR